MADSGAQIVLGHYDNHDVLESHALWAEATSFRAESRNIFYPIGSKGHGSPSGNALRRTILRDSNLPRTDQLAAHHHQALEAFADPFSERFFRFDHARSPSD